MTSCTILNDVPTLAPGDFVWRPAHLWNFSGPLELRSGDATLAEAEWLDADPPEWRVDAGREELAFRIVEWKPMHIEVVILPGSELVLTHQASKRRPRPAIEVGDSRYYLVSSGGGWTDYLAQNGSVLARMRAKMTWHGGTTVSIQDPGSAASTAHLWVLTCYVGFRVSVSYRHFFKGATSPGLRHLIGRASDYHFR